MHVGNYITLIFLTYSKVVYNLGMVHKLSICEFNGHKKQIVPRRNISNTQAVSKYLQHLSAATLYL